MAPKGKKKIRLGQKEIHKNNLETLKFYLIFSIAGTALQVAHLLYFHFVTASTSWRDAVLVVWGPGVHIVCRWVLTRLAQPHFGPSGELVDAGAELRDNYISEYVIDCIILTSILQGLSFLTNLVWLLWLAVPGYVVFKAWKLLIWPWLSQGSPSPGAADQDASKKHKNKVKYMRR